MWRDEIVEEVRRVREEHAAKFNYDLDAIFQDLKRIQRQQKNRVVSLKPKKVVRKKRRRQIVKKAA